MNLRDKWWKLDSKGKRVLAKMQGKQQHGDIQKFWDDHSYMWVVYITKMGSTREMTDIKEQMIKFRSSIVFFMEMD